MSTLRSEVFRHVAKIALVNVVVMALLGVAAEFLPRWIVVLCFLVYAPLFFSLVFAVGPLGRRLGRRLNEAAAADASEDQKARQPWE